MKNDREMVLKNQVVTLLHIIAYNISFPNKGYLGLLAYEVVEWHSRENSHHSILNECGIQIQMSRLKVLHRLGDITHFLLLSM